MKLRSKPLAVLVIAATFAVAGCRGAPIMNIQDAQFGAAAVSSPAPLSFVDYEKAIIRAGSRRGWTFTKIADGHLEARVNVRGRHTAVADILHDTESYSILYKSSTNLDYNAETGEIHQNYNSWIGNLNQEIQKEVQVLRAS